MKTASDNPNASLEHELAGMAARYNRRAFYLEARETVKRKPFGVAEWLRVALLFGIAGFFVSAAVFTLSVGFLPDNMKTLCWIMLFTALLLAVWFVYDIKGVTFQ